MSVKLDNLAHVEKLATTIPAALEAVGASRQLHKLAAAHYGVEAIDLATVSQIIGTKLAARRRDHSSIDSGLARLKTLAP